MPIPVQRLNHAVLYVRSAEQAAEFYEEAFGFQVVTSFPGAVFLKAVGTDNHHDLGLFSVGDDAAGPTKGSVGLYHLAWQVPAITDLMAARETLTRLGALVGESDHGATKSLYGKDPDGNEFEVMWMVPRDQWGDLESDASIAPLDLEAEVARYA